MFSSHISWDRLNAPTIPLDLKEPLDAHIGMLKLLSLDVYFFPDLGSMLSYVTPYVPVGFGLESHSIPFFVSTLIEDSVVVNRVYRGSMVSISGIKLLVDLIELGVVNFDIVLRMDYVYLC